MAVRAFRPLLGRFRQLSRGQRRSSRPVLNGTRSSLCGRSPTASQCPLTFVVGRLGVAALQEHKQLVAAVEVYRVPQLAALGIGRLACEQPFQLPFETAAMRGNGGAGEIRPAAAECTRVLEKRLEVGREDRIAVVDGVLRIADQMREAELVLLGVPQLRGQTRSKTRHFGTDNARSGSDCKRPATNTSGPSGKPGKSLRCASNSVFIWGIPDETR